MSYRPGTLVRVRPADPDHHTRVPRYVRGHVGEIVERQGEWPLPDDSARGIAPPRVEAVYAVRFPARDLWGAGSHTVTVDLWESYLEEVLSADEP
jgi:nitrile hydratase